MRRTAALAAALLLATPAFAFAGDGWDGTWVDALANGDVQLIIAGDQAVGLYWNGDYVDALASTVAPDGKTMTLRWGTNVEALARLDDGMIGMMIRQYGKPDVALVLRPDK